MAANGMRTYRRGGVRGGLGEGGGVRGGGVGWKWGRGMRFSSPCSRELRVLRTWDGHFDASVARLVQSLA